MCLYCIVSLAKDPKTWQVWIMRELPLGVGGTAPNAGRLDGVKGKGRLLPLACSSVDSLSFVVPLCHATASCLQWAMDGNLYKAWAKINISFCNFGCKISYLNYKEVPETITCIASFFLLFPLLFLSLPSSCPPSLGYLPSCKRSISIFFIIYLLFCSYILGLFCKVSHVIFEPLSDVFHLSLWSQNAPIFSTNSSSLSFFRTEWYAVVYKHCIFFTHLSVDGRIESFQHSVLMSSTAVLYSYNETAEQESK